MKIKKEISSNGIDNNLKTQYMIQYDPAERTQMIAISAYFRAENRGFSPNSDLSDWLESEREIDRHLSSFSS